MAPRRNTTGRPKHSVQESLFTQKGTPRKRRPRTFARGKRSGRPKKAGARLRHERRAELKPRFPVHVTWKLREGLPNLRSPKVMSVLRLHFRRGKSRFGFRLVHFSVQKDHVHLVCEAEGATSLTRGLQGLAIRVAKGLNRHWKRRGKVFADRYHARILETPSEVKWALGYVLCNTRRHNAQRLVPRAFPKRWVDAACTSSTYFDGWHIDGEPMDSRSPDVAAPVVAPSTYLLTRGWARHGPIATDHVPGPRKPRRRPAA